MLQKSCPLLILLLLSIATSAQGSLKEFYERQDLTWDTLSTKWEDGAFLGNGVLGMMVYKESDSALRFVISRTDVTDHREGLNPSLGKARLPIGRFVLRMSSKINSIALRLDLWNAALKGTISTSRGKLEINALAPAGRDIMVIHTSVPGKSLYRWEWIPELSQSPFRTIGRDTSAAYKPNPMQPPGMEKNIYFQYQPLTAGGSYTTAWKEMTNGSQTALIISIANSYPEDKSKRASIDTVAAIDPSRFEKITGAHRAHWHAFYRRSNISIPDSRLQSFWTIQQYKMGSATRVGAYPIDLMGPWYYITPWPKYWWNLNAQLTYYPFFSSNHIDLAQPLLKMIDSHIDNLANNAPEPYRHNSAALGRSGPYDMTGSIKVMKGNDSARQSSASLELGNLSWLLHVYYQAYEYTMDKKVLRSLYPVLTRAVNYYRHIITKESDGKYHLPYTYSPEYPKGITRDANYDLALLRWSTKTLLHINKELKLKDSLAPAWQDLNDNLAEYPADNLGYRIGRDADFSISHRHYSHLLMIYPVHEINWDVPEHRDFIRRSLNQWKQKNESWRGYSYTGSGSIHALMREGDSTWKLLNEMMKGRFAIKPNTMYLEAGPVIETPLSAVTTINEMLLQSWGGVLRVFPAIPVSWDNVSFDKLLAKGGFEVSAERKNGATSFIRIRSNAGSPCIVQTDLPGKIGFAGVKAAAVKQRKDGRIEIDLQKGQEVILYSGQKPASFEVPFFLPKEWNYWGLKKP